MEISPDYMGIFIGWRFGMVLSVGRCFGSAQHDGMMLEIHGDGANSGEVFRLRFATLNMTVNRGMRSA